MAAQLKIIGSGMTAPSMDRQKALEAELAQMDRAFGKGSAMKLGRREEVEIGDSHVGMQARLMSQALRKLTGSISRSRCTVIFINQVRMKIGVMYGNPETTTGGNALKFYASVRLDIRRTGQIKDRDDIVGNATRVKV